MINSVIRTRKKEVKNNKKKVLLVINCLQGGGAERVVLTLGQGFYDLGYEVHILRFKPRVDYELNPKLNYHFIDFKHPCICVSKGAEKDFVESFGNITPTIAIHNPVDRDYIQKLGDVFTPEYQDYIVHVGSFKEAKRHDVLLKAYARTDQSMPLLLLGKGKLKDEIEQLVVELNLEEKVVFLGFQENPFPYIKHPKFKVLTSDWEGFALVIAEALVLGTPDISTDCPSGPSELLPDNNLMPMSDVDAISEKLSLAMKNPEQFFSEFDGSLLPITIAKKYIAFASDSKIKEYS